MENYYDVLIGICGFDNEGTELRSYREVADFIDTHKYVRITEEDGTPLLKAKNGGIVYCNDMRYREELLKALHRNDGFRDRYNICGTRKKIQYQYDDESEYF